VRRKGWHRYALTLQQRLDVCQEVITHASILVIIIIIPTPAATNPYTPASCLSS
jgi:hypothetical protein